MFRSLLPIVSKCQSCGNPMKTFYSSLASYLHPQSKDVKFLKAETMIVHDDYITEQEEHDLMKEIEPYFKRTRYESSHWDHAIVAYRETEKSNWNPSNAKTIDRIREFVFNSQSNECYKPLALVHVLDLAKEGEIKAHVDSVKFCGEVIAGLSLLSPCVMRLVHEKDSSEVIDVKLNRRSLYVMKNEARYDYSHAILGSNDSIFNGEIIARDRRVSIIFRCEPPPSPNTEE